MSANLLPDPLRHRPFTVAMASVWGLTERQVHRLDLNAPARGVRCADGPESLLDRCVALALVLECFAYSHLTAAQLHGLPVSRAMADEEFLHVMRDERDGAVRRAHVVGHRGVNDREITIVDGLPVVDLADTWVDMGELIAPGKPVGLDDLIVLGDAIATRLGSVEPMREALDSRVRPRGKLTLQEALEWIRVGSESPGETRTRLVLVRGGIPEPELNQPVIAQGGCWLGRPDMRWKTHRVLAEYQGREFHDSDDDRARDEVRFKGFADDGWTVVDVWNDDVNSDEARCDLVLRVADELEVPRDELTLSECHPRFFSIRMLELAQLRARRLAQLRARRLAPRSS